MANEIRLRSNNIAGTITNNPLSNVATTINSAGFIDLPTVDATNHLILILDPLEVNGAAEIVRVTAHTAASAVGTVVRGVDNSVARTHILGTTWFHGPVVSDYNYTQRAALSTNRPIGPFAGEMIFETDTGKMVVFGGTDWSPRDAGGTLGYAQAVANQGPITAEVDLTGLSLTVTVGTNRRIRISTQSLWNSTGANEEVRVHIKEGATFLQTGIMTLSAAAGAFSTIASSIAITPTAGVHTYKISAQRQTAVGTTNMTALGTIPAFILVEDIGAV